MKFLHSIFILMAIRICESAENSSDVLQSARIVGGHPVSIKKHPYLISLRYWNKALSSYNHVCGGSIYSERVIITAAHCVFAVNPKNFRVEAGISFRNESSGNFASLKKIIIHENFFQNDIAILVLNTPLSLNNETIRAIQLEQESVECKVGTIAGWGKTSENGSYSYNLREVQMPIVSNEDCKKSYDPLNIRITDSMLCAGFYSDGGKDACDRDSGGPLVVNGKLAGVVSFGNGCGRPKFFGVYTKISYMYDWLMKQINSLQSS